MNLWVEECFWFKENRLERAGVGAGVLELPARGWGGVTLQLIKMFAPMRRGVCADHE